MTLPAKAAEPNSENLQFFEGAEQGALSFPAARHVVLLFGFPEKFAPSVDPKMSTGSKLRGAAQFTVAR